MYQTICVKDKYIKIYIKLLYKVSVPASTSVNNQGAYRRRNKGEGTEAPCCPRMQDFNIDPTDVAWKE